MSSTQAGRQLHTGHLVNGPVLLMGRASSPSGTEAYRLASNDLVGAADALARVGVDCRPYLPSVQEMMRRLRQAPVVTSEGDDGKPFHNRFVDIDLIAQCGVYVVFSTGSGKKLDDSGLQPFVTHCGEVARQLRPGLTFGKRFDRIARTAWGLAPLMIAINPIPGAHIGDETKGALPCGAMTDMLVFFETRAGEVEADKMPLKTRRGMKDGTVSEMVDGKADFGVSGSVPAGFGRVRMLSGGALGHPVLFVDCPEYRPDPSTVSHGLPTVMDVAGKPVDQAENVRWALRSLAAGMTHKQMAAGLVERQFSTDLLRLRNGPDAVHGPTSDPGNMITPILARLDLYETGRLVYTTGLEEIGDIVVSNCFPPQGEWATPADFDAIRERQAHGVRRFSQRAKRTFAGLRISGDASTYALRHYRNTDYSLRFLSGQEERSTIGLVIPHDELAGMIRDAVVTAGVRLVKAVDTTPVEHDPADRVRRTEITASLTHLEERRDRVLAQLDETGPDGNPRVTGPLLQQRSDLYGQLIEQIEEAKSQLAHHERQIARLRRQEDESEHQARTDQLLELVASLRDPSNVDHRELWTDTVTNLTISLESISDGGLRGRRITLTGDFTFKDGADRFTVPMHHQYDLGGASRIDERVDEVIRQMCEGAPLRSIPGNQTLSLGRIAEKLGSTPAALYAFRIDDPTLLRTVMATVYCRNGRSTGEIADELGVPVELVERVEKVHKSVTDHAKVAFVHNGMNEEVVALYVAAANNGGLITPEIVVPAITDSWAKVAVTGAARFADEWRITSEPVGRRLGACAGCGSHRRAPTAMILIKGLLCLDCMHDSGGLEWREQDLRYVQHPDLWGLPTCDLE